MMSNYDFFMMLLLYPLFAAAGWFWGRDCALKGVARKSPAVLEALEVIKQRAVIEAEIRVKQDSLDRLGR